MHCQGSLVCSHELLCNLASWADSTPWREMEHFDVIYPRCKHQCAWEFYHRTGSWWLEDGTIGVFSDDGERGAKDIHARSISKPPSWNTSQSWNVGMSCNRETRPLQRLVFITTGNEYIMRHHTVLSHNNKVSAYESQRRKVEKGDASGVT